MVSYWKTKPRSQGGHRSLLKTVTLFIMVLAAVSTIFFMYQDGQNLYVGRPQRIPIIVTWTPFFSQNLKTTLLPTLNNCPYQCHVINRGEMKLFQQNASAYVFHGRDMNISDLPPTIPNQLKVLMLMESPHHAGPAIYRVPRNYFNATMTYRRDSRYFYPYGQFVTLATNEEEKKDVVVPQQKILDALKKKTRGSLIFVSNCNTPSKREFLIKELAHHTEITVRGGCENRLSYGNDTRGFACRRDCSDDALIATHRFYISFENSLCNDYITEKFYSRISQLLLPVVVKRRIYEAADIPPGSFVALDDFNSIKELGDYLNFLRRNDTEYLKYFEWIKHYRLPSTYKSNALCKLCEDIHRKEAFVVEDIIQHYIRNQCSDKA